MKCRRTSSENSSTLLLPSKGPGSCLLLPLISKNRAIKPSSFKKSAFSARNSPLKRNPMRSITNLPKTLSSSLAPRRLYNKRSPTPQKMNPQKKSHLQPNLRVFPLNSLLLPRRKPSKNNSFLSSNSVSCKKSPPAGFLPELSAVSRAPPSTSASSGP